MQISMPMADRGQRPCIVRRGAGASTRLHVGSLRGQRFLVVGVAQLGREGGVLVEAGQKQD
jgi:hypothetical protein